MRYKDEFHIASTAVLLSMAMFGISVVVPKESRVPTAKTTLTEAPETAAEAEAAQQAEFPIYSQDSNYDEFLRLAARNDTSYDSSQVDGSYDNSDTRFLWTVVRLLILQKIPKTVQEATLPIIPIFLIIQRIPSEDYGTEDSGDLDYTEDGSGTGSDNGDRLIRRILPVRILNTMNKKNPARQGLKIPTEFPVT